MSNKYENITSYMDRVIHQLPATREVEIEIDQQDRHLIQSLARADFSAESRVRQSLRRKLLTHGKELKMYTSNAHRQSPRLILLGVILALIILAISPIGVTLAQSIVNIVQTWTMGKGTTAVSVEGDFMAVPDETGKTIIQPAPEGGMDEPALEELMAEEGAPALGENLSTGQASELVNFKLLQPAFIPEGYDFQGVTVINAEKAQMDYLKFEDIGLIGLGQTVVGGINGDVQVTFTSDMTTVEVQVNGQDGIWISTTDGFGMLMWEADGINYQLQLMGVGDLELALRIAESLQ